LGRIPDPTDVLCIGDLFLLPSETESFGLAALEAMAMKMPVISTNAGGLPEVNVQGKTGFMSAVGNTDEMAANAIKILSDDAVLQKFRENAYQHAKKFDVHSVLPRYEELYNQLLAKSKGVSTV
jgi:glycosyltransferase involved in cell wall biosynthesis